MKNVLFVIFVIFGFIMTGDVFAWNISYHKNLFGSTDYTAYLCDDYTYGSCDQLEAKYTVGIKIDELFGETTYYFCEGGVSECDSWNSFGSRTYSSSSY